MYQVLTKNLIKIIFSLPLHLTYYAYFRTSDACIYKLLQPRDSHRMLLLGTHSHGTLLRVYGNHWTYPGL